MAQGTCSPFKQTIGSFANRYPQALRERFEPITKGVVLPGEEGDYGSPIFLRNTYALNGVPPVGSFCVAVYDTNGPAIDRAETNNIVHPSVSLALLLRSAGTDENSSALEAAAARHIRAETAQGLAMVFEGLIPRPGFELDGQPVYTRTAYVSPSFLPL